MSVYMMSLAWKYGPPDPINLSVFLVLADHADDNGHNCFPSISRIADYCRRSDRTVTRSLHDLEEEGWITVTRATGRGTKNEFFIETEKLEASQNESYMRRKGGQPVTLSDPKRVTAGPKRVTATTIKGDSHDKPPHPLKGVTTSEPPENHQENLPDKDVQGDEIPKWIPMDAWNGWLENRRKKKSPVTGRSRTIALNKLAKWLEDGYDLTVILDAATFANWQGLYLPKGEDGAPIRPEKPKRKYVAGDPNNADDWVRACFDPDTGIHYDPITNPPPPARA